MEVTLYGRFVSNTYRSTFLVHRSTKRKIFCYVGHRNGFLNKSRIYPIHNHRFLGFQHSRQFDDKLARLFQMYSNALNYCSHNICRTIDGTELRYNEKLINLSGSNHYTRNIIVINDICVILVMLCLEYVNLQGDIIVGI